MYLKPTEIPRCTFWIARQTQPFPEITTLPDSKNPSTLIRSCNTLRHCILWAAAENRQLCPIPLTCSCLLSPVGSCDCPESQISIRKLIITWNGSVFCQTNKLIQINYIVTPWVEVMERSWMGHARENEEEGRSSFSMTANSSHSV